jgi:hypothetical protein
LECNITSLFNTRRPIPQRYTKYGVFIEGMLKM